MRSAELRPEQIFVRYDQLLFILFDNFSFYDSPRLLNSNMDEDCSETNNNNQKLDTENGKDIEKKKGLSLLIYDLKQPKLIPIKILSLIVFSGE
jgi:hypothetical protein